MATNKKFILYSGTFVLLWTVVISVLQVVTNCSFIAMVGMTIPFFVSVFVLLVVFAISLGFKLVELLSKKKNVDVKTPFRYLLIIVFVFVGSWIIGVFRMYFCEIEILGF
jgi:hypothetical protein